MIASGGRARRLASGGMDGEYQRLSMPAGTDRRTAWNVLAIHAAYGEWELERVRMWPDGRRKIVMRRKVRPGRLPVPVHS